jgi:hypothetical protein
MIFFWYFWQVCLNFEVWSWWVLPQSCTLLNIFTNVWRSQVVRVKFHKLEIFSNFFACLCLQIIQPRVYMGECTQSFFQLFCQFFANIEIWDYNGKFAQSWICLNFSKCVFHILRYEVIQVKLYKVEFFDLFYIGVFIYWGVSSLEWGFTKLKFFTSVCLYIEVWSYRGEVVQSWTFLHVCVCLHIEVWGYKGEVVQSWTFFCKGEVT